MDHVTFTINGVSHSVGSDVSTDVMLVDYIRDYQNLRGTKYMCRGGGCGACIVSVVKTPGGEALSVNSCLIPVTLCHGWEITTVEKVGNKLDGYHSIQKTIAKHFGTQCGYCSPGWVMAMYSLLQKEPDITMLDIEKSFAGNICRCTGYRPIMEALKTFGSDAPVTEKMADIEELKMCGRKCKKSCKETCNDQDWLVVREKDTLGVPYEKRIELKDGKLWFRVTNLDDIFQLFAIIGDEPHMIICGNTAQGTHAREYPSHLIDISQVQELKGHSIDQNLIVGGSTTLDDFLVILRNMASRDYFSYLEKVADHVHKIANVPVRNQGTIAGNLMLKHLYNNFASDLYVILETVGAYVTIATATNLQHTITLSNFLEIDMNKKILVSISLPPINHPLLVTFKMMPRSQGIRAIVNCGFFYKVDSSNVVEEARIVYSGLSGNTVRATNCENYLKGKDLFSNETLQEALTLLDEELVVTENAPYPSVEYRKHLALALFYKGLLILCPQYRIGERYRSGAINLNDERGLSESTQVYATDESLWPITKPIEKVEAMIQTAGEASYSEDVASFPREVFATFVLSTVCTGEIINIDPSEALALPGVIAFYSAKDIPGLNSFTPADAVFYAANEEVLCSGTVKYYQQPIGIIVAETRQLAERASKLVTATYSAGHTPVIELMEAKNDSTRLTNYLELEPTQTGTDVTKVITGSNVIHWQYHMTLETMVCVTQPVEDSYNIYSSTQWMDATQTMIARALKMDAHKLNLIVRRLGGGYGIKISRANQVAIGCTLVSKNLNRPCRFIQSMPTTMAAVGKRLPCATDYEIGVNDAGAIQYMKYNFYEDNGYMINETLSYFGLDSFNNCYDSSRWTFNGYDVITDTAKNTWCRSPATLENIAHAELIMDHIAYAKGLDPVDVRLANLNSEKYGDMITMIQDLKTSSEYARRRAEVDAYNKEHRWKKRGLRFSCLRWTPLGGQNLNVTLTCYHVDGTVAITHGGIEMGQGMNTKAVQAAAYHLNIPVEKIRIEKNFSMITPNCYVTGASLTTQNVLVGVRRCCEIFAERLAPLKQELGDVSWEELITAAHVNNYNLQANAHVQMTEYVPYDILGVALCETEMDILTGQREITRVDILQDVGRSLNPGIDVGQVEGAFVMGLGYWTMEEVAYNKELGKVLIDSIHAYSVPLCRDIPQNFVVGFKQNSYSADLILGSKGVGEPAICLSVGVYLSLREGVMAARRDAGLDETEWYNVDGPCTVENLCLNAGTKVEDFKFI